MRLGLADVEVEEDVVCAPSILVILSGAAFQAKRRISISTGSAREPNSTTPRGWLRSHPHACDILTLMPPRYPTSGDRELIQIVDAALADTTLRSGKWLVCRPGCTQCCIGAFAINQLDAARLRRGLDQLDRTAPQQAAAIRQRARDSVARLAHEFPGDPVTGILNEDEEDRFEDFANDEPCPVLDPSTGLCGLYESRPMTCRVFGPPVKSEDGLGVCELCFQGATEAEIAACEMVPDPEDLESRVLAEFEKRNGLRGNTIIAFALAK